MHPCPWGLYGDAQKPCTPFGPRAAALYAPGVLRQGEMACAHALVTKYQKRISGPLLDRIDIHIEVLRVDYEKLNGDRVSESSEVIRTRVEAARNIQRNRFGVRSPDFGAKSGDVAPAASDARPTSAGQMALADVSQRAPILVLWLTTDCSFVAGVRSVSVVS